MTEQNYVLVTAARNEAKYIEKTLRSVVNQTILPIKWAIISDGSTDATDEIIRGYEAKHAFIKFIRVDNQKERDFASKVFALRAGFKETERCSYRYIGILDADISFRPDYYEKIINEFNKDPKLGIAGGLLLDCFEDKTPQKRGSSSWSVPGGIQLFRKECFDKIGGIMPLRHGEEDMVAEVKTRMAGYTVKSFYDITGLFHHRPTGTADRKFPFWTLHNGLRDYYVGTSLSFEIIKCLKRVRQKPYFFVGFFRLCGYFGAALKGIKREIPDDVIKHLQSEQKKRLFAIFKNPFSPDDNLHL